MICSFSETMITVTLGTRRDAHGSKLQSCLFASYGLARAFSPMDIVCIVGWVSFFMLNRLLWWRLVGRSSSLLPWSVCSTSSIQLLSLWNCTQMVGQPALVDDCGDALGKSVTQSILFAVFVCYARQNNCQGWQRYKLRLLMSAGWLLYTWRGI